MYNGHMKSVRETQNFAAPARQRRRILIAVTLSVAIMSWFAFFWIKERDQRLVATEFSYLAQERLSSLDRALENKVLKLRSLAVLHEEKSGISWNEFPDIVQRIGFDMGRIRSIGWIPRIAADRKRDFENQAQKVLGRPISLFQRGQNGTAAPAKPQPVHYPIYYSIPEQTRHVAGYDLASNSNLLAILNQAAKNRSLATGIVAFPPTEGGTSLLAVYPAFNNSGHLNVDHGDATSLAGFYYVLAPVGAIYEATRGELPPSGFDLYIFETTSDSGESRLVLFSPSRMDTQRAAQAHSEHSLRQGYFYEHSYSLGPDAPKITFLFKPTDAFVEQRASTLHWQVLFGGQVFACVLLVVGGMQIRNTNLVHRFAQHQSRHAAALEKEVEERKLAEESLKSSNVELEAFVYTVSHDLRSPLSAIIGHAEILQMTEKDSLSQESFESLETIEEQGRRMNGLMEDLLEMARVGRIEPPQDDIDTSGVLDFVLEDLKPLIIEKGAALELGELPNLKMPESLLGQIFENLIGNALRYACAPGGKISVWATRSAHDTKLYVRDHGNGIPVEEREKIFEVFYRGSTGKQERGTGIGLATVRKIARQYGGDIRYEETPGGGATFVVQVACEERGEET